VRKSLLNPLSSTFICGHFTTTFQYFTFVRGE